MQMAERNRAFRQVPVDRRNAERQHPRRCLLRGFHALKTLAQLGNRYLRAGKRHPRTSSGKGRCSYFVLIPERVNAVEKRPVNWALLRSYHPLQAPTFTKAEV